MDASVPDVRFVLPQQVPAHKINFFGQEHMGFHPVGIAGIMRSANCEKVTYWYRGKTPFLYGVLLFKQRVNHAVVTDTIAKIASVYPVHNGIKRMGVIVFEKGNMRGIHAIGDFDDLCHFWVDMATGVCCVAGLDVPKYSVCWTTSPGSMMYVPYLDIDELGSSSDDFDAIWGGRVSVGIKLVADALRVWNDDIKYQIFMCIRKSDRRGLCKFSFHVHFYTCLVGNISDFKSLVKGIEGIPKKRTWTLTAPNKFEVTDDPRSTMFDLAVYGGAKQLFRGPYCGKGDNRAASMKPVRIDELKDGSFHATTEDEFPMNEYVLRARISSPPAECMTVCAIGSKRVEVNRQAPQEGVQPAQAAPTGDSEALYALLRPLVYNEVVPLWQAHRASELVRIGGSGATVPVTNINVTKDTMHRTKAHVRYLTVAGDTFCETDPSHHHSRSNGVLSIGIDLTNCTIWQHCFACGCGGVRYHFLHTGNTFRIKAKEDCRMTSEEFIVPTQSPHAFLLMYHSDIFGVHRPTDSIYVFDEAIRVWRTGSYANAVIGVLLDALNLAYMMYTQARQSRIAKKLINQYIASHPESTEDEVSKHTDKILSDGRKFISKFKTLITITATARGKMIEDMRNFNVKRDIDELNVQPNLIPMKGGVCVDVFTGETTDIHHDHMFTGIVAAELVRDEDDIAAIIKWFLEISSGDEHKSMYMKRIAGYMMTFLMHDRKFYVLKGTGKNGKGIFKQFLISVLSGAFNTESRWKALNQTFWERKANSMSGSEAPSPEAHGMLNRTLFYTDDIERVCLDAGKVKRVVAGEVMSGRPLYGRPVVIAPKGKILWTTNHLIDLPGGDNAAWERFSPIDFKTKYVDNPAHVDHAQFKFAQDDLAVVTLLSKTDAFFTVCVDALVAYYKSLKFDPATGRPSSLSTFPVPVSMSHAKDEARAQQLPLANFINTYAVATDQPLMYALVQDMFNEYIMFLDTMNERRLRNETTQMSFVRQLATSLEIKCTSKHVIGWAMPGGVPQQSKQGRFGGEFHFN
jgi:hypothetical protein